MQWIGDQLVALHGDDFPAAVLALVTLVALVVAAWALLVMVLAASPTLRHHAVALTPPILRGLVVAGATGALTVPAARADETGVDGLRLPDRPLVADTLHQREVVVRPGDTLWAIAGGRPEQVRRWYRTNRAVIGADPDLILPGQRLTAPSKDRP
jgi:nucleoid-associated protein YgaU